MTDLELELMVANVLERLLFDDGCERIFVGCKQPAYMIELTNKFNPTLWMCHNF